MKRQAMVLLVFLAICVLRTEGFCQQRSSLSATRSFAITLEVTQGEITAIDKARRAIIIRDAQGREWLFRVGRRVFDSLRIGMTVTISHRPGSTFARRVRIEKKIYMDQK